MKRNLIYLGQGSVGRGGCLLHLMSIFFLVVFCFVFFSPSPTWAVSGMCLLGGCFHPLGAGCVGPPHPFQPPGLGLWLLLGSEASGPGLCRAPASHSHPSAVGPFGWVAGQALTPAPVAVGTLGRAFPYPSPCRNVPGLGAVGTPRATTLSWGRPCCPSRPKPFSPTKKPKWQRRADQA